MPRLPQPGGDQGTWGEVLNDFLSEAHNSDGSLKDIPQSKVTGLNAALSAKAEASAVPAIPADIGAEPEGLSSTTKDELQQTIKDAMQVSPLSFELRRSRPARLQPPATVHPTPPTYTYGKGSGMSAVSIVSGGSGYSVGNTVTIDGGTSVVPALVYVVSVGVGGAITGVSVHRPGVYSVNPSNPVLQAATSGSGTGATFTVTMNGGVASGVSGSVTSWGPTGPSINFYGNGPTADGGMASGNETQCYFEFSTDAQIMDLRFTAYNTKFQVFIDGMRLTNSEIATDASGGRYIMTLDFGGRAVRTIRVVGFNMKFVGVLAATSVSVWRPNEPKRPKAWVLGDSYTFGTGSSDTTASVNNIMAECLGLDLITDGIGGAGWTGSTAGTPAQRVATKLGALNAHPEIVFLDLGYNNAASTPNVSQIEMGIDECVAAVRLAEPDARIIAFGPATPLGSTANLMIVRDTIQSRATALGFDFIDVAGWVTSSNSGIYTGVDNTHPNAAGHRYLGERKARAVAALLAST